MKIDWCLMFLMVVLSVVLPFLYVVFLPTEYLLLTHIIRITAVRVCNSGQANVVICSVFL